MDPWIVIEQWGCRKVLRTLRYMEDRKNRPDRTDFYLMQIAKAIIEANSTSDSPKPKVDDLRLRWLAPQEMTQEEIDQRKAIAGAIPDVEPPPGVKPRYRIKERRISKAEAAARNPFTRLRK